MSTLDQHIHVRPGYLRATNVEQHAEQAPHYIPTGRALDVLGRVGRALHGQAPGHAWSMTGPYGAGKSSFAVFLSTLLGPDSAARRAADMQLQHADMDTWKLLASASSRSDRGFVLATTTCQPEPATDSLLRGLQRGVKGRWARRPPAEVRDQLERAHTDRSPRAVAAAVRAVAQHAPVLLLLDEFGKTLEHFASSREHDRTADLFVLQELAEQAPARHPLLLLTLQHLAFDDYVRSAPLTQRREWGKIAGRFEDVPFLETAEQSLRLVVGALDDTPLTGSLARRRRDWSANSTKQLRALALHTRLAGGEETLEHCYPLHPVALLALPALCARLGQHGRTLFTFLASDEPHTLGAYLRATDLPATRAALPTLNLAEVYDFFSGPGQTLSAAAGLRWTEIDTRIREATGLPEPDLQCLKTVGLLNLLADATGLRASAGIVSYALSGADSGPNPVWQQRLEDLEARGWLTYRGFADEYRLWQGSDVDLRTRVADAREQLRSTSPTQLLNTLHTSGPVIAGKHTQRVGMLRYFSPHYADASTQRLQPLTPGDPADGALVYFLDDPAQATQLCPSTDGRPVLLATSTATGAVRDAAIEAAAALAVLDQRDVAADRVARRELQDRAADTRRRLATVLEEAYRPGSDTAGYQLLTADGAEPLPTSTGGLSRLLSDVCDRAYRSSPEIRNEMLGRRELTSQGAKARRDLLEAMVTQPHSQQLGLSGYGPERSMYEALLHHTGLHREQEDGSWAFSPPRAGDSLLHAWGILTQYLNRSTGQPVPVDELYGRLKAPPIGLKDGPIPVLLAALLLHRSDDVAVYQEGTYQPEITADLLERLLKAPEKFALKAFDLAGARGKVLDALLVATGLPANRRVRGRNATVLRTAAPLLAAARALPTFTRKTTKALSTDAERVRDALLHAREPDVLLFHDLPVACGLPEVPGQNADGSPDDTARYAERLASALDELNNAYRIMLRDRALALADEFELSTDVLGELRIELRVRARRLEGTVLEPKLRSLLFHVANAELEDDAWLEGLALTISGKPPVAWTDDDVTRFDTALHGVAGAFARVEALHFEAAARRSDGFTAQRVTVTAASGQEASGVVWVDDSTAAAVQELADEVEKIARQRLGAQGTRALLAALATRHLTPAASTSDTATTAGTSRSTGTTTATGGTTSA